MADEKSLIKVADAIRIEKDVKIIVVSAGGKTDEYSKATDMLIEAWKNLRCGESPAKSLAPFFQRVRKLKAALKLNVDVESELMKIEDYALKAITPDFLLSRGEYLYSLIFSRFLHLPFVDAADIYTFNDDFTLNADVTYYKIRNEYKKRGVFVCGGFYGATEDGRVITLSRGGGDVSGAVAARAINADCFVDFTDVDGVYAYNPSVISQNAPVKRLSYEQIRRLGEFGASVLHPDAVLPLIDKKIPVVIKNTFAPTRNCTIVSDEKLNSGFVAASKRGCAFVKIKKGKDYPLDGLLFSSQNSDGVNALYDDSCRSYNDFSDRVTFIDNGVTVFFLTGGELCDDIARTVCETVDFIFSLRGKNGFYFAVKDKDTALVEKVFENFINRFRF